MIIKIELKSVEKLDFQMFKCLQLWIEKYGDVRFAGFAKRDDVFWQIFNFLYSKKNVEFADLRFAETSF